MALRDIREEKGEIGVMNLLLSEREEIYGKRRTREGGKGKRVNRKG